MINNKELDEERVTFFEKKIKPALLYIGTIGATLMVIAYIAVVLVMIFGFNVKSFEQSIIFAAVNGVVGFVIMQLLRIQGVDFAKTLPQNKKTLDQWYNLNNTKVRKLKSIKSYWVSSIIKDILMKVVTIVFTSCALIYIVVEGSNDYSMLLLAIVNLIMFVCFGLLALVSAYDFYNNEHIPYIKNIMSTAQEKLTDNEQVCNQSFKVGQYNNNIRNTDQEMSDSIDILPTGLGDENKANQQEIKQENVQN